MTMIENVIRTYQHTDTIEDAVCEAVLDYKQTGKLLTELLEWNAGSCDWDGKAMEFVSGMMADYIGAKGE